MYCLTGYSISIDHKGFCQNNEMMYEIAPGPGL